MFVVGNSLAQTPVSPCGPLTNRYGPYDYRVDRDKLPIVEEYHFSAAVEAAIAPQAGAELDYTLKAFPNHHRALAAMLRLADRTKLAQPPGVPFIVECYFERALRFRDDDVIVRMMYASFLQRNNRSPEVLVQLARATELAADNAFTHYNIGLIYFESKKYDEAVAQAQRALELGLTKPELRDQLKAMGKWKEPREGN